MAKSKIIAKVEYDFPISYIIFMIQGHLQCQRVNLKVK